ncbi:flagellar hook-length control protein FliK [Vibrio hangzhouensis]|uniref:Flagellar hook-length control protein FliK n=1 Tax=Vibrio hangzhouensis TaxID=462991 RepID=A0A1H5ZE93_9VIBR|nr:flagellar hook-length control protein FliK [Vibrio hangzhouensis]SEG34833.1 flagellar hook-length control protein FliK [Vibrio hangzhouensis]
MSLSISNNTSPTSATSKVTGTGAASEKGDVSESQGFFDKLKGALTSEKADKNQKVDVTDSQNSALSESTQTVLKDAQEAASTDEESVAVNGKASTSVNNEESEQSVSSNDDVKKMTGSDVENTDVETNHTQAGQSSSDQAKQAVNDSSALLNRLDEANKALKPDSQLQSEEKSVAIAAGAAQVGSSAKTETSQASGDIDSDVVRDQSATVELADLQSSAANTTSGIAAVSTKHSTGSAVSDNSLTPGSSASSGAATTTAASTAAVSTAAVSANAGVNAETKGGEGDVKTTQSSNIAWTTAEGENGSKVVGKAALASSVITSDKSPVSAHPQSVVAPAQAGSPTPQAAGLVTPNGVGSAEAAAVAIATGAVTSPDGNKPAASGLNASSLPANGKRDTGGIGQGTERPDGLLQATGAGTLTANQLRAEQPQSATGVQSPLVLTKENASEQVSERLQMMMSKNLKHVDIRLDPPDLGRMQIRMTLNNDSATVHFTVQNQQTRDMVDQAMPRLREMLSQQGIQLADTSVQQQNQGQQRHASHGTDQQSSQGSMGASTGVDESEGGLNVNVSLTKKQDGISYYA